MILEYIKELWNMFATGDFLIVKEFIASYGKYAAIVSFLLMILTALAAPLPAFLITFANANLFGWWKGAILSWTSAMVAAVLCFMIAKLLGRNAVIRFTSEHGLVQADKFFEKYGQNTILICRLLPFVSFDLISYAAGLTSTSLKSFVIATGLGQLPATIIYSYVGSMLSGGARIMVTGLLILFALMAFIMLWKQIYYDRKYD